MDFEMPDPGEGRRWKMKKSGPYWRLSLVRPGRFGLPETIEYTYISQDFRSEADAQKEILWSASYILSKPLVRADREALKSTIGSWADEINAQE